MNYNKSPPGLLVVLASSLCILHPKNPIFTCSPSLRPCRYTLKFIVIMALIWEPCCGSSLGSLPASFFSCMSYSPLHSPQFPRETFKADSPPLPQSFISGKVESPSLCDLQGYIVFVHSTSKYIPKRNECRRPPKDACKNVDSNFIHVSQKLAKTQMSIHRRRDISVFI